MLWLFGRCQTLVTELFAIVSRLWFSLQEIHHERLRFEFLLVYFFLSHGALIQLNGCVVAGLSES